MDKYKVKINQKAVRELHSIYEYIANEKSAPETAKSQTDRIKKAILNLSLFPESHQERIEGRFSNQNFRQLIVDNYLIIFKIDEAEKTVRVVTIQYQGRNL